jgi:hypothetical protein
MIVTAWNNGAHSRNGNGYGFKLQPADRDAFFKKEWPTILLDFPGEAEPTEVKINQEALWSEACREISCPAVGKWLRHNGLAPWAFGNPPRFILEPVEENRFKVVKSTHKESRY